jgi:hypothetical protein
MPGSLYVVVSDGSASSAFRLERMETVGDETVVYLGPKHDDLGPGKSGVTPTGSPSEYRFPSIHVELARLEVRWKNARLPSQEFNASAQNPEFERKLAGLRKRLREAEA